MAGGWGVAHDFNNLLTVIQATVINAEEIPSGSSLRMAWAIRQASQRAAALTRPIARFQRKQILSPRYSASTIW